MKIIILFKIVIIIIIIKIHAYIFLETNGIFRDRTFII